MLHYPAVLSIRVHLSSLATLKGYGTFLFLSFGYLLLYSNTSINFSFFLPGTFQFSFFLRASIWKHSITSINLPSVWRVDATPAPPTGSVSSDFVLHNFIRSFTHSDMENPLCHIFHLGIKEVHLCFNSDTMKHPDSTCLIVKQSFRVVRFSSFPDPKPVSSLIQFPLIILLINDLLMLASCAFVCAFSGTSINIMPICTPLGFLSLTTGPNTDIIPNEIIGGRQS